MIGANGQKLLMQILIVITMILLTAIVPASSSVQSSLPASLMRRHLISQFRLIFCHCVWTQVTYLQLGKVLDEVLERHPTTSRCIVSVEY